MFSLDGNVSSITLELSNLETEHYNALADINIRTEKMNILKSKLSEEEKNLTSQLLNNINAQLVSLRSEIGNMESQLLQNIALYGEDHGAVEGLKLKINTLKQELNKKVNDLIKKGTTVKDPLAARQETVSNLLSLESEIISLRLKLDLGIGLFRKDMETILLFAATLNK